MAYLSKYAKQRIVSLKESGLTSREVVQALKHEGATVIRVQRRLCDVATNDFFRVEALRGEKDQEGRPCAPVPF